MLWPDMVFDAFNVVFSSASHFRIILFYDCQCWPQVADADPGRCQAGLLAEAIAAK